MRSLLFKIKPTSRMWIIHTWITHTSKNVQEGTHIAVFHTRIITRYNNIINNNNSDQYQYQDQVRTQNLATSTVEVPKLISVDFLNIAWKNPKRERQPTQALRLNQNPVRSPEAKQPITGGGMHHRRLMLKLMLSLKLILKNDFEAGTSNQVPEPTKAKRPEQSSNPSLKAR